MMPEFVLCPCSQAFQSPISDKSVFSEEAERRLGVTNIDCKEHEENL